MRIVFMGTPDFAVPALRRLAAEHDVVAVYTRPDRPRGRGRRQTAPPVKRVAHELGIPVRQPSRMDESEIDSIARDEPDVLCVAAYGAILPARLLDVPRFGALNVHASLLPRHRGAAPVERAILEGDETTGVSIMRVEPSLDTGPVAPMLEVPVGEHTADSLRAELASLGANALIDVLDALKRESVEWTPQDDSAATYAEKITAEDVALHPGLTSTQFLARVRAASRRAPARLSLCGTTAVVVAAEPAAEADLPPGAVRAGKELLLGTADGVVRATRLRPENRADMDGRAFACGLQGVSTGSWEGLA
jgi:methionyl-tRNA formyltransferase